MYMSMWHAVQYSVPVVLNAHLRKGSDLALVTQICCNVPNIFGKYNGFKFVLTYCHRFPTCRSVGKLKLTNWEIFLFIFFSLRLIPVLSTGYC